MSAHRTPRRIAALFAALVMTGTPVAAHAADDITPPGTESGRAAPSHGEGTEHQEKVTPAGSWTLRVTDRSTTVRTGPRSSYKAVRVLSPGKPVEYSQVANGWGRLRAGEWVYLGHTDGPGASRTRWTIGTTNVRFGPSTEYSAVQRLSGGTRLTGPVVNGWQRVGDHRWVSTAVTRSDPGTKPSERVTTWPTGQKVAYLTFDDGPNPVYTPRVLDVLDRYDVPATFFAVGSWAQSYPGLVKQARAEGHKVTNHSWNHPDLRKRSDSQIRNELVRTQNQIGGGRKCFRPPYGATNDRVHSVAGAAGFEYSVLWSAGGNDWERPGERAIADEIVNRMTPGGIALMHDGGGNRSQTVGALDDVIKRLRAKGYTFRTLPMC
ncbi:polysaccharide deacetylase family protein [Kytococcus sp. Marseille-QA3725]